MRFYTNILVILADNGVVGGAGDEAIQRVRGRLRVVPWSYGGRYLVAYAGL